MFPVAPIISPGIQDACAVGVGAVCGALSRYQVGVIASEQIAKNPKRFSRLTGWHTAGINILGSFALGMVASAPTPKPPLGKVKPSSSLGYGLSPRMKLLMGVGFCGAFTTFSTYSVDVMKMVNAGENLRALSYVLVNNAGSIAGAGCGMYAMKKIVLKK